MHRGELDPRAVFKAKQKPALWLLAAERLRDAAEIIMKDQIALEPTYFRAVGAASLDAQINANSTGRNAIAEIEAEAPNYVPAQMLYGYALENLFKGMIVNQKPGLIGSERVSRALNSHDLIKLAEIAAFPLAVQEVPLLAALSKITVWAGRYPVPLTVEEFVVDTADSLLDWGALHPTLRYCFDRAFKTLEEQLPKPVHRFGVVVATPSQPISKSRLE
jgi:hypothetical protein